VVAVAVWRSIATASLTLPVLLSSGSAWAHSTAEASGDGSAFEPWVVVLLTASAALYGLGLHRLWRSAGPGRGVTRRQWAAFATGWIVLASALTGPVDAASERYFWVHMVQHELMMIVAAPLLVIGRPLAAWAWALPSTWARGAGRLLHRPPWRAAWRVVTAPAVAWALHAAAVWLWHLPTLFDSALRHPALHALQHASFLGSALLFWWSVLGAARRGERCAALVSLVTTMLHTGARGALLTLSQAPWYRSYMETMAGSVLGALGDQQVGGAIMWVPTGFVYLSCALVLAARWMNTPLATRSR
jgi:putative membrane protein